MTVPDCMLEYETLAAKVFGRPRIFIALRFGLVDRTKYKAADLKKVFENVTERRSEPTSSGQRRIPFPSKRGLCKTSVSSRFPAPIILHKPRPETAKYTHGALFNLFLIPSAEVA